MKMKTLIITLFIWLLFTLSMKAQTDPTVEDSSHYTLRQKDNELIKQPQPDLVQVDVDELPPALLKTLEKPKFEGWRKSVIYKNKSTKEYMFTIGDGDKATTYRFNANGELIKKEKDN
jgi:hypothetical protein